MFVRSLMLVLVTVLGIAMSALTVNATNWYVDNSLAASICTGTSWTTAWTNICGISWTGIRPGDTVYISGGRTAQMYDAPLKISKSGTTNALITISVGQDADHGGQVIIDGSNTNTALGGIVCGESCIHITGLPNTNFVVQNWVLSSTDREQGIAFYGGIAQHQVIEGVAISNVNDGFYYNGAMDIEVRYCSLKSVRGDYAFRLNGYGGVNATNFLNYHIHHCDVLLNADFAGGNGGPDGVGCLSGVTLHDCKFRCTNGPVAPGQHPDGIQSLGSYLKVYNNYFANFLNSGFKFEPLAPTTQWVECYAYNNIVAVDDLQYAAKAGANGKGTELGSAGVISNVNNIIICNNDFVDLVGLGINGGPNPAWACPLSNFVVENNIFFNCGKNTGGTAFAAGATTLDYNLVNAGIDGGSNYSPTQANPRYGRPRFKLYLARSQTNDWHLVNSDVAARRLGANLFHYFGTDKDGNPRPASGFWDIGAHQISLPITSSPGSLWVVESNSDLIIK